MFHLRFSKMNGAGNDFIVTDDSALRECTPSVIRALCDRRRGIGADGMFFLSKSRMPGSDHVTMEFYNCDGSKADMCGNGLRCAAMYAFRYGLASSPDITFSTGSGDMTAHVLAGGNQVRIELPVAEPFQAYEDVDGRTVYKGAVGVPHAVCTLNDLERADVIPLGRHLRHHPVFGTAGANVDFLPVRPDFSKPVPIRTYERGVEDETLACGTGICSSAVVLHQFFHGPAELDFVCRAGDVLHVSLECTDTSVRRIHLTGPAVENFRGTADLP